LWTEGWPVTAAQDIVGRVQHFLDDDNGYLSWLARHPDGSVINTYRQPTPTYLLLHRATCKTITGSPARGTWWTADYSKICGDRDELLSWARAAVGAEPRVCPLCA
jgi:hypothetical protein